MNKKLQKQISKKLQQLDRILDEIRNFDIEPDDSEMWDADYYADLTAQLKEALALLEDNSSEEGLCFLLDEYQEQNNEDYV